MKRTALQEIEYNVEETWLGAWRRYVHPDGQLFAEFVSHQWLLGLPLVHYTRGRSPETGRRVVATGVVAVGRLARGVVAIGHASVGIVAFGQLAVGLVFGLGQAATGMLALGQLALGLVAGIGQLATGAAAIGQLAIGRYALGQIGIGEHVWDTRGVSPIAEQFFRSFLP